MESSHDQQQDVFDRDFADFNYKLILVGHTRVGKTSIINRFVNEMFNDKEQSSTCIQVQKKPIRIDKTDKWAQLHLWDTLGQETYQSLTPLFFRKAVGVFLVFDCTSMESFKALDGWFEQMSNTVDSKILIMLLGNKCDLPHREVPYNLAMEYARKKNFGFLEVSAKSGSNIKNAFNCLVREIHRCQVKALEQQQQSKNHAQKTEEITRQKGKSIKLNYDSYDKAQDESDGKQDDCAGKKDKKSKKNKNKRDRERCLRC